MITSTDSIMYIPANTNKSPLTYSFLLKSTINSKTVLIVNWKTNWLNIRTQVLIRLCLSVTNKALLVRNGEYFCSISLYLNYLFYYILLEFIVYMPFFYEFMFIIVLTYGVVCIYFVKFVLLLIFFWYLLSFRF
jgi:hypothetical protein